MFKPPEKSVLNENERNKSDVALGDDVNVRKGGEGREGSEEKEKNININGRYNLPKVEIDNNNINKISNLVNIVSGGGGGAEQENIKMNQKSPILNFGLPQPVDVPMNKYGTDFGVPQLGYRVSSSLINEVGTDFGVPPLGVPPLGYWMPSSLMNEMGTDFGVSRLGYQIPSSLMNEVGTDFGVPPLGYRIPSSLMNEVGAGEIGLSGEDGGDNSLMNRFGGRMGLSGESGSDNSLMNHFGGRIGENGSDNSLMNHFGGRMGLNGENGSDNSLMNRFPALGGGGGMDHAIYQQFNPSLGFPQLVQNGQLTTPSLSSGLFNFPSSSMPGGDNSNDSNVLLGLR
jgi:hypothetical protein